jgi:hypothetical protein
MVVEDQNIVNKLYANKNSVPMFHQEISFWPNNLILHTWAHIDPNERSILPTLTNIEVQENKCMLIICR